MAKRKTKMISIRVSESEYDLVKSRYASMGNRSVSDFAREALHVVLRDPAHASGKAPAKPEDANSAAQVRHLTGRLDALQTEVTLLARMLNDRLASGG